FVSPIHWLGHLSLLAGSKDLIYRRPERIDADGFLEAAVCPGCFRLDKYHRSASAYDDNWSSLEGLVSSHRADEMESTFPGQGYVGDYQIGIALASDIETLFCFTRRANVVASQPKQLGQRMQSVEVIFHDQHSPLYGHSW